MEYVIGISRIGTILGIIIRGDAWGGWSKIGFIIKAMNIWQWWVAFMFVGFSLMSFIICEQYIYIGNCSILESKKVLCNH